MKYLRRHEFDAVRPLIAAALFAFFMSQMTLSVRAAEPDGTELFESKIRPLLVERCQKCHGVEKQWSGLRLDSRAAALTGGDSGPSLVPEQPDESELLNRVTEADDELRMPPAEAGSRLNDEQIALLRRWIEVGAPWPESLSNSDDDKVRLQREHWAFQPVKHPTPPQVIQSDRVKNAVDQFVLQKLESAGLQLSAEADRRTLIRRATYDLTGLPPAPAEVTEFVNDTAPDAYERLIERLLASPRYGEQLGRDWLDIARYADTKGYTYTREQRHFIHAALYRDWVIRAFNKDIPYNDFVLLQLAADQAAPEDPGALAAMGFLTLGRRMLGVTPDIIEDRIDMVGRGLLGLTIGCARCHDHKYDPIPTADYYSLYGVFQNCTEHQVPLPKQHDAPSSKRFTKQLAKLQKELASTLALRRQETSDRVRARLREYLEAQRNLDEYSDLGVIAVTGKDELLPGFVRRWEAYLREVGKAESPIFAPWTAFANLPSDQFSSRAADITRELLSKGSTLNPRVADAFTTPPASADEVVNRYVQLFAAIESQWQSACKDAKEAGLPQPRSLADPTDEALRQVLYGDESPCIIPDEPIVNTEYLWDLKTVEEIWKLQSKVDTWLLKHPNEASYAVVLKDLARPVDPQIFRRGNPMNKGEIVPRQFLKVIAGPERKPFEQGSGRLELAQAIVDPKNPLTARVWVNRVWLHHFGAGLVTTPSDFGVRSAPPSHPDLLDWLTNQFIEHGWSTKWLHQTIMRSAVYRQSSKQPVDAAQFARIQEVDPDNRLLWRMNPRRLTFEQFRDTLIATSGELDDTMGGKAVNLFSLRRSVYAQIDRQFLPSVFNVFDFASPDFHSSERTETTTPQQALFALNNPFLANRARRIAATTQEEASALEDRIARTYQTVLQRDPTPVEASAAAQFLTTVMSEESDGRFANDAKAWSYGYGAVDLEAGFVKSFRPLPHFAGAAWQGGPKWPDARLGWVQLTAKGGHTGNDHQHAAIRRWTANAPGTISIKSEVSHQEVSGDGIRCWIISSRSGILKSESVYNERKALDVDAITVEANDTVDFVADYGKTLNSDMFIWIPSITQSSVESAGGTSPNRGATTWNSDVDFPQELLTPWEQFTQMLLISNELMFVD